MKPERRGPSVVAIVQARMSSERLPGKVLLDIEGQTMLERVVQRVRGAKLIDDVVVATPINPANDAIVAECARLGVAVFRGSEDDVLDRYHGAAVANGADVCVRVCADSPFVDPAVCDEIVGRFVSAEPPVDYVSNKLEPTFPLGLDAEAFSMEALERAWREASESFERAHVTVYMYQRADSFRLASVATGVDRHDWRWTVDTPEDLAFARAVFERLGGGNAFGWQDVVALIEREPELAAINSHLRPRHFTEG